MQTSTLTKLLVPIDYSGTSLNALDLAIAMSKRHDAEIRLLHVVDPNQYIFVSGDGLLIDFSRETVVEAETRKLEKLAKSITDDNAVRCSVECRTGNVCPCIVEAAQDFEADCIVMGAHGTSGIREYFLGSDAYRVVKTASCPVMTVPNHQKWTQFNEILFPIRPVLGTLDKYATARKIVNKNQAHLLVLGVFDLDDPEKIETLDQAMAFIKSQLQTDNIRGDTFLTQADSVAQTVLQKAEEFRADLIVITADIDAVVQDFFVGPYAQQIVNHAKVPVLSIRPKSSFRVQPQPLSSTPANEQASLLQAFPPVQFG